MNDASFNPVMQSQLCRLCGSVNGNYEFESMGGCGWRLKYCIAICKQWMTDIHVTIQDCGNRDL